MQVHVKVFRRGREKGWSGREVVGDDAHVYGFFLVTISPSPSNGPGLSVRREREKGWTDRKREGGGAPVSSRAPLEGSNLQVLRS